MANHVNSYICIRQISEEGQKVWNEIVSRIQEFEPLYGEYHLAHLYVSYLYALQIYLLVKQILKML